MCSAFRCFQLLVLSSLLSHGGHISDVSPLGQEKSATVYPIANDRQVRTRGAPSQEVSSRLLTWSSWPGLDLVNVLKLLTGRGEGDHHDWLNPILINHWGLESLADSNHDRPPSEGSFFFF